MKNDLEKPHGTTRTVFGQARQNESASSPQSENQQRGRLFKICPECGAKNPGSREFCSVDGVALDPEIASVTALPIKNTSATVASEKPELETTRSEIEPTSSMDEKATSASSPEIKRFSNWNNTEKMLNTPSRKPRYGVWLGFAAIAAAVLWFSVMKFQSTEGIESRELDVFSPEPVESNVDEEPITLETYLNTEPVDAEIPAETHSETKATVEKAQSKPELKTAAEKVEIEPVNEFEKGSSTEVKANISIFESGTKSDQQSLPSIENKQSAVVSSSLGLGKEKTHTNQKKTKMVTRNPADENSRSEFLRELKLLLVDNGYAGFTVTVSSANIVTLKGVVSDFNIKENVLSLVNGYDGVVRVRDKIFVIE